MNRTKNNLAIIGASYLQVPLIEKAKEMGYVTHVFAWQANDVGEFIADFFYPISIVEKDAICEKCKEIGIVGICSIASDLAAVTVNYVAQELGLVGNSMESVLKSTNKHIMRKAFEEAGDPSPKSIMIENVNQLDVAALKFPIIVKPTDRSGSRGICKLESAQGIDTAINNALNECFEKKVLVEEFAEGDEYSVEYISFRGLHHFLAITKKFTTGAPHFIETGHLEPASISPKMVDKIKSTVEHALNTLGIENSASHTEIKIDKYDNIKIIEIGGRMGGDCIGSHLVKYSTGVDFVRAVIQVACNIEPDLSRNDFRKTAKVVFILNQQDLHEFEKINKETPEIILDVVDFHPELIGKTSDSSNRAGCYIIYLED